MSKETTTTDVAVRNENVFEVAKVNLTSVLPNLAEATEMPIDLTGLYWTPENKGEVKRMFFVEIRTEEVLSSSGSGEIIDLDCAVFIEQVDGVATTVINGSRRLVGVLESYIKQGMIGQGTPLQITYMGKKKNKSNNFQSDSWSIKPLQIKI